MYTHAHACMHARMHAHRCAALDDEDASMADWRTRDAHEFLLAALLGVAFWLNAFTSLGVFVIEGTALNPNTVAIFLCTLFGAFMGTFLAYAFFVSARWLPPAAHIYRCTVVPSFLFRAVALLACLAYLTAAVQMAVYYASANPQWPLSFIPPDHDSMALFKWASVGFHSVLAFLNFAAALVAFRRLQLQHAEDTRPCFSLIEATLRPGEMV